MSGEWDDDAIARLTANPFYAINIAPMLAMEHDPIISEEQWVDAQVKNVKDLGLRRYLWLLLRVLKGDYVAAVEDEA